jgi:hypothetical protein
MRKAATLIFGVCGLLLLLTWHHNDSWYWIWAHAENAGYSFTSSFRLGWMDDLDFVLKIAGLAFIGLALLVYQSRKG